MTTRVVDITGEGNHAARPAAASSPDGMLYSCTDHDKVYKNISGAWTDWAVLSGGGSGSVQVDEYATTQSATLWSLPVGALKVRIEVLGAGGGGGSGRRAAAATVREGGCGGGGGGYTCMSFDGASLPASLYVWVGAGGTAGAAIAADSTNGNTGNAGGPSFVTSSSSGVLATAQELALAYAGGGSGGLGGTAANQTGVAGGAGAYNGGLGGGSNTALGNRDGGYNGGGGGGGSISSTNGQNGPAGRGQAYHRGGISSIGATSAEAFGTAGLAGSTSSAIHSGVLEPGCGASGGAVGSMTSGVTVGGDGGAGIRGGGGGGGGGSTNSVNSGAGGAGGTGYVIITTWS